MPNTDKNTKISPGKYVYYTDVNVCVWQPRSFQIMIWCTHTVCPKICETADCWSLLSTFFIYGRPLSQMWKRFLLEVAFIRSFFEFILRKRKLHIRKVICLLDGCTTSSRDRLIRRYIVARYFFLLLLDSSAWLCVVQGNLPETRKCTRFA